LAEGDTVGDPLAEGGTQRDEEHRLREDECEGDGDLGEGDGAEDGGDADKARDEHEPEPAAEEHDSGGEGLEDAFGYRGREVLDAAKGTEEEEEPGHGGGEGGAEMGEEHAQRIFESKESDRPSDPEGVLAEKAAAVEDEGAHGGR